MTDRPHDPAVDSPHPTAHELSDVDTRSLLIFLGVMVVALTVVAAIVYWQYRRFEALAKASDPPAAPRAGERQPPPTPHLQVDEAADMARLIAEQQPLLDRLEWISRDENIVRIPIERAMEIVAAKGVPDWPAAEQSAVPSDETSQPSQSQRPDSPADRDQPPENTPPPDDSPNVTAPGKETSEP
jgi:hypothetical protein